ncbi:DsbA family protein [Pyruvatibacter sp.]|uniref:DsbA family protein n=1 Tax=Pyruvatibacter sp. TaxID=1981328 RepID=UPI0032EABE42
MALNICALNICAGRLPGERTGSLVIAALVGLALLVAAPIGASAQQSAPQEGVQLGEDVFSDVQKEAIGEVIRDYLIANPQLMLEVMDALDAYESIAEREQQRVIINANRDALERDGVSYVAGNPEGSITVIEFFDYRCPYCKQTADDMQKLIETTDDVRLVLKELPILGPDSTVASQAAIAAVPQGKYLPFHFALLRSEGKLDREKVMEIAEDVGLDVDRLARDMESARVEAIIDNNRALAREVGVRGTPAFIIGDELVPGAAPLEALEARIEAVRDAS